MRHKFPLIMLTAFILASVHIAYAQQQKKVWRIGLFHVGLDHVPGSLERANKVIK